MDFNPELYKNQDKKFKFDLKDLDGRIWLEHNKKLTKRVISNMIENNVTKIEYPMEILMDRYLARPIYHQKNGEIIHDVLTKIEKFSSDFQDPSLNILEIIDDLEDGTDASIINAFIIDDENLKVMKKNLNRLEKKILKLLHLYQMQVSMNLQQ